MDPAIRTIRISLVAFLFVALLCLYLTAYGNAGARLEYLTVRFLDVGQGDAVLVTTPDGVDVLIDGGPGSGVLRALGQSLAVGDRAIDLVVGTHPDSDHIGGLIDVLLRYDVGAILTTENKGESSAATRYREAIAEEGAEIIYARRGQTFQLGVSTTLSVLFPEDDPSDMESNSSSIVLQLRYGDIEFMLTGDSPKRIEEYLVLRDGAHIESDVLKVGHHGSHTSTAEDFLVEVDPQYAVISAGKDNRYGHPHVEVTDLLFNHGVTVFSTAEQGTITFLSDGKDVWPK